MALSALAYAAKLIRSRLRSAWEIDQALLRRGVEVPERLRTLTELTEMGLLDDRRFAKAWVTTRDRLSPRGELLLRRELVQKGIAEPYIAEALTTRTNPTDEPMPAKELDETHARELAERKRRQYAHLPKEVEQRRLAGFLERRGFSPEIVRRILFS